MSNFLNVDLSKINNLVTADSLSNYSEQVKKIHQVLHTEESLLKQYLGWVNLPVMTSEKEIIRINSVARRIRQNSQVLLVIGIGGSYLGAHATISALTRHFPSPDNSDETRVIFVGQNLCSCYISDLIDYLKDKTFSINVISKSGTTTEPAIAFRLFKQVLESSVGKKEAAKRIYITTDEAKGDLRQLAHVESYESFVIPDDVGGRYSVFTPVGLLPVAVAGFSIDELIKGAKDAAQCYDNENLRENDAYLYAVARHELYLKEKNIECLVQYEPSLSLFSEWWKQLFGESEGKENKGIFPASLVFPTDLHSLGQYIQEGRRNLFVTTIKVSQERAKFVIEREENDFDQLNYLAGKSICQVNEKIFLGAKLAHVAAGVPNVVLTLPFLNPYSIGYLMFFFKKVCAMSGMLLGINPFDQPGVEAYKTNMFAL